MGRNGTARGAAIAGVLDNLRRVFQVVHGYSKRAERAGGLAGPQLRLARLSPRASRTSRTCSKSR